MGSTNLGVQEQTSFVVFIQTSSGPAAGFLLWPTEHWLEFCKCFQLQLPYCHILNMRAGCIYPKLMMYFMDVNFSREAKLVYSLLSNVTEIAFFFFPPKVCLKQHQGDHPALLSSKNFFKLSVPLGIRKDFSSWFSGGQAWILARLNLSWTSRIYLGSSRLFSKGEFYHLNTHHCIDLIVLICICKCLYYLRTLSQYSSS